jgi:hypothetical protein
MKRAFVLGLIAAAALGFCGRALAGYTDLSVVSAHPGGRVFRGEDVYIVAEGFLPPQACSSKVDVWFSNLNHVKTDYGSYRPQFSDIFQGEIKVYVPNGIPASAPYGAAAIWVKQKCGPNGGFSAQKWRRVTVVDRATALTPKYTSATAADALSGGKAVVKFTLSQDAWTPMNVQYELTPGQWVNVAAPARFHYADAGANQFSWAVPAGAPAGHYRFAMSTVSYAADTGVNGWNESTANWTYAPFSVAQGLGAGTLSSAGGAAINGAGSVVVADSGHHRLARYRIDGVAEGAIAAGLTTPADVAAAPDGGYFVADSGTGLISRVDRLGAVISRFGARGPGSAKFSAGPVGLAVTATNVYSVDGANPFVSMFNLNGVFGTSFPGVASTLTTPIDIAAAPDGTVYVVDGRRTTIAHFTATGGPLASVPLPSARAGLITPRPTAIDVDSHGRLIVPDAAQKVVWVLDGKGRQLARVGAGLLQVPSGVTAAGTAGDFYVVDRAANRVLHFRVPA